MGSLADVNGMVSSLADARVPVLDRGFLYGDAVYEVVRVFAGAPFHLAEHLERLEHSLGGLQFVSTPSQKDLIARAEHLVQQSGITEGVLYFQITRGAPPSRSLFPDEKTPPTVVITIEPSSWVVESLYQSGVSVCTRKEERWLRADLKTVNLIPRILAKRAAKAAGAWEVVWMDSEESILEGGATNIFAVMGGVLRTSPLGERLLAGITRQQILALAGKADIPIEERSFSLSELFEAEEVFLTGTTTEVLGVVRVDEQQVAAGKPGPITRRLRQALKESMTSAAATYWS